MNPLHQLPGKLQNHTESLIRQLGSVHSGDDLLWHLRRKDKDKLIDILRKSTKGRKDLPTRSILDILHQMPKISLRDTKVAHTVDKVSGRSRGELTVVVDLERAANRKNQAGDGYATLSLIVGSFEKRQLLAYSEISISRQGAWSVSRDIDFDWDIAQSDGGEGSGSIIVRLQLDTIRGMDSESIVALN
jgi:hypothetical protein